MFREECWLEVEGRFNTESTEVAKFRKVTEVSKQR